MQQLRSPHPAQLGSQAPATLSFEQLLSSVDVVSFDCFDTLIQRAELFSPKDLFYQVQAQAAAQLGSRAARFAELRVRAEERARSRAWGNGCEDITLDTIYAELAALLRLDPAATQAIQALELACERAALSALPSGRQLFQAAQAAGKRIVIATDTYLSADFIGEVLAQHGYAPGAIFVSSAYGKSKAEGGLYDVVLRELGCRPSRLLHVGDNQLADVTMALGRGVKAWYVPTPRHRLRWRHGLSDQPSGNLVLSAMLAQASHTPTPPADDLRSAIAHTARHSLALLYLSYAAWLIEQLRQAGYRRVYFAAREGLIIKRCFDMVAAAAGITFDSRYLYISRTALYPSLIFTDPVTARRLFAHTWDHVPLATALERIGLSYDEHPQLLAEHGLLHPQQRIDRQSGAGFSAFLNAIWPQIERRHANACALTIDYLRQEQLLTPEPAAFVDIGWHGSLQNCLLKLLHQLGIQKRLGGYYLGTFDRPADAAADFQAQGYLVDQGAPASIAHLLRFGPSLLELFHSAGHGSVLGYERRGPGIVPILQHNAAEVQQHRHIIEPLQSQALEQLAAQLAAQPGAALHAPDAGLVARAALRVIYAPTMAEALAFGCLQIATDFGGPMKSITGALEWNVRTLAGKSLPDGQIPIWRPGFRLLQER